MEPGFTVSLDDVYTEYEVELEDTQPQSDIDEPVSEEEDEVEYQPEDSDSDTDTDTSDQSDDEATVPPDVQGGAAPANVIKMTPGITRFAMTRVSDIKSCFDLFLPWSIKKIIIDMTNLEGKRVHKDTWHDIDVAHLDAYIGIVLLAGVYRSSNEATESLWDASTGRNIFRATMSLHSFRNLTTAIRFDKRDVSARSDKLAPIRNVWEKWVQRLPLMFNPGPEVTVDERLLPFRGKCPFRQYMPSKPGKYGIKIWAACDARTSYAWNLQIYTGKDASGIPEKKQGKRIVLDMATGLQGHNITCDNFFTSYELGQELLRRKLTMVGTVRKTKPDLPAEMLEMNDRDPLSSKFVFTDTTTLVSYCPRKGRNVMLMSTRHKDAAVSSEKDKKPIIILDYNKNKGGVDTLDKLTGTYTCQRMTRRWSMVVFYNILDVSAYNALVLWTHIHQEWNANKKNKRRLFLEELGGSLVKAHIERREYTPRDPGAAALVRQIQNPQSPPSTPTRRGLVPASPTASPSSKSTTAAAATTSKKLPEPKRKRCQVCPSSTDRKSSKVCFKCKRYLCHEHIRSIHYCDDCT
ncbi:piggyBac transposable element-derived protein 4-like [Myripristis murdjan]|uniref:piggyBac transposable element-derived protein 4-like n=1 Tax=Myripristis murdjan TaxID=586833 RepID=UPI001175C8CC|nr:piggyBac transposable element-derived protein 4-like [Myripristis murdjan]